MGNAEIEGFTQQRALGIESLNVAKAMPQPSDSAGRRRPLFPQ
jgi:hypothetical protein